MRMFHDDLWAALRYRVCQSDEVMTAATKLGFWFGWGDGSAAVDSHDAMRCDRMSDTPRTGVVMI